ncbi:MAG: 4Fe-4S dicluster domain-containing protein [Bacteroidales bacterium]|nr:4Fe-4S dicluster domain-containing protein [Bacteroidales bacterium]
MAIRVNPRLIEDLNRFGAADVQMCYHCGDCSAVCVHTDDMFRFPRKSMRQLQMGLEKRLDTALEPWLCYYCGQCSDQCPREAHPGETMMSLRRWLINRYDITGIAGKFFRSVQTEVWTVIIMGLLTALAALGYHLFSGSIYVVDGPDAFLPSHIVHMFDIALGSVLGIILLLNALHMWSLTMKEGGEASIPWWLYIKSILQLPLHFFTQKRYAECITTKKSGLYMPWIIHLGLMWGYVTMLVLVMVFLPYLQKGPEIFWPAHIFGYLASIGLLTGVFYFIRSRLIRKYAQYHKSHSTDWVFVILLALITITGILQHIFHRTGLPVAANITYLLHLMVVVPWLLRMPFSKWAHLVYRPLAMYFAAVRKNAYAWQEKKQRSFSPDLQPI